MTDYEINVLRANILGGMNTYVREAIKNDIVTDFWNKNGISNDIKEEELIEIAANKDNFYDITETFNKCLFWLG